MSDFQKDIGGTSDCMRIIMRSKKVCRKFSINDTLFSDSFLVELKQRRDNIRREHIIFILLIQATSYLAVFFWKDK